MGYSLETRLGGEILPEIIQMEKEPDEDERGSARLPPRRRLFAALASFTGG
jgi:hypothetical protein